MKQFTSLTLLFITCFTYAQISFVKSREYLNISDWLFKKGNIYEAQNLNTNTIDWKSIKVPHTYSMDAIEENGYYRGVAWYRNKTMIPNSFEGKQIYIRFEAVGQEAKVYINGINVGAHSGGYSAFCFNISDNCYIAIIFFEKEHWLKSKSIKRMKRWSSP